VSAPKGIQRRCTEPADQPKVAHQRQLAAAGYGGEQRTRYIKESGEAPEYAARVWDE
jgi:hypothetical protein